MKILYDKQGNVYRVHEDSAHLLTAEEQHNLINELSSDLDALKGVQPAQSTPVQEQQPVPQPTPVDPNQMPAGPVPVDQTPPTPQIQ